MEVEGCARKKGGTNELTKRTLSADAIIGENLASNNTFIPIAVLEASFDVSLHLIARQTTNLSAKTDPTLAHISPINMMQSQPRRQEVEEQSSKRSNQRNKLFGTSHTAPSPRILCT